MYAQYAAIVREVERFKNSLKKRKYFLKQGFVL